MCGINGFYGIKASAKDMNKSISHRGPNDSGEVLIEKVTLGQVRLSILDLSEKGHQPMGLIDNKAVYKTHEVRRADLVIVFNGEIYNYQEIKKELPKQEYQSNTDTEVILKAYKQWGEKCIEKFNGMWSFCIYDTKKQTLFCSRDRLGQKPFYYHHSKEGFMFSSELKSIKSQIKNLTIDPEAVDFYFDMGCIPAPWSIYKEVRKLEAAHNLTIDIKKNTVTKSQYFEIQDYEPSKNKQELISKGKDILKDAVRLRLISDVPVGAFLSGGLDSSAVVGEMAESIDLKNLHTFSMGFEGKYDETPFINIVKDHFNTKHHHYYFKKKDYKSIDQFYNTVYDEPFADYSGYPTIKISEIAKKQVTVALSGDGGDEIFGGYNIHIMGARMQIIRKIPKFIRKGISKINIKPNLNSLASTYLLKEACKLSLRPKNEFYSSALEDISEKSEIYKTWSKEKLTYCLRKTNNNLSDALRVYDLLFATLSDKFLVKVDRASMKYALEVRSPFLDYRFINYSQTIPHNLKANTRKGKILMREIIKDLVPKTISKRGKKGFQPPINEWINEENENLAKKVDQLPISKELKEFYRKKALIHNNNYYNEYKIKLSILSKWCEKWE